MEKIGSESKQQVMGGKQISDVQNITSYLN